MNSIAEGRLSAPLAKLEEHGLKLRTLNCLEDMGYATVGDLQDLEPDAFLDMKNVGKKVLGELRAALRSFLHSAPECLVESHEEEVRVQERCRDLAGRLRQAASRVEGFYRPELRKVDRAMQREAATALMSLLEENERLWGEVRRLKVEAG